MNERMTMRTIKRKTPAPVGGSGPTLSSHGPDPALVSRRGLLGRAATAALAAAGVGAAVAGCKKAPLVCDGIPGIAPADVQLRATLDYKDISPALDRQCVDCTLYVAAPTEDACGGCKVVRGPVNLKGTCRVFLRKPAATPPA
jgi:hypothetical protein